MKRVVCATLSAALHVAAVLCIDRAPVVLSAAIAEQSTSEHRALRVTAFISDEASSAPRLAALRAADVVQSSSAIELPLPELPAIDPIAADSFARSSAIATSEDVAKGQRLQGLYVGQIKARLLRLLEDARNSAAASNGHCVLRVVQDERGRVLDVMSDECEGDAGWQRAVEDAIRRASPLPLPPEGLAMGSYLTLDLSTLQ